MDKDELQFQCHYDNCSRSFKRRDRLEIHLRTHTGERPFACLVPGCSNSYARSQHLSRHIQRVHFNNDSEAARMKCPHCDDVFANLDSFNLHEKRFHTISDEGKLYKCPEEDCCEVFRKKPHLVAHKEKYHNQQLSSAARCYKCPHEACGKSFPFPNVLRRHMKIHEGYKCDIEGCNEVLFNWSSLRKHKAKDHFTDLVCHTCQSSFKTRAILVQHIKIHQSNKESVVCIWEGCDRTFLHKKNLTQHIRAYHEGKQVFIKKPKPTGEQEKFKTRNCRTPRKKTSIVARICGLDDHFQDVEMDGVDLIPIDTPDIVSKIVDKSSPVVASTSPVECDPICPETHSPEKSTERVGCL